MQYLRGSEHANAIMTNSRVNSGNSLDRYLFPSYQRNQIPSALEGVSFETPLMFDRTDIPKLDEMNSFEFYNAATYFHPTSHQTTDSDQFSDAEPFRETPPEKNNGAIEREIDEFIKSILRMHSNRQIGSEIEISSEKDEDSSRSVYMSRRKSSESGYTKKRKSSSSSQHYEKTLSDESVSCNESRVEYELHSSYESFGDRDYRNIYSRVHKYEASSKEVRKSPKRRIEPESTQLPPNNKYPLPPPGIRRKKTEDISLIQTVIKNLKYPCVGLNGIIEIQGMEETSYYCEMCDLPCSYRYILAHLETYQHRLESLKPFAPLIYEDYSKHKPYEIEDKVNKTLKILVEMFGCGEIKVEKEYPCDSNSHVFTKKENRSDTERKYSDKRIQYTFSSRSRTVDLTSNSKSVSSKSIFNSFRRKHISSHDVSASCSSMQEVTSTSRLGTSYNYSLADAEQSMKYQESLLYQGTDKMFHGIENYYCDVCNARIYKRLDWEMHITGQRHITNVKIARGEMPFRRSAVVVPYARAALMDELDNIKEPVVGLDMIRETQDSDAPMHRYMCLLCSYQATAMEIINHILSLKHRMQFLEDIEYPYLCTLRERGRDKHSLKDIVRSMCADVEAKQGRGYLSVYIR